MRPHTFSRTFVRQHSINQAIVLKHLAHKTQKSSNWKDDKQWYFDTTDELMKKWPYLGRSTIDDTVKKLAEKGLVEIGNYNKRAYDRTRWFHVQEEHWAAVEEDLLRFKAQDAEDHGVPAAVLLWNLEYWLKKKPKAGTKPHKMMPTFLATKLPLSLSTIKSVLAALVKKGVLVKVKGVRSEYAFSPDQMRSLKINARLA